MENYSYPDWRHLLPPEIPLSRHGYHHPLFSADRLRCFTRSAEIMKDWGAWCILAPEEPAGPHPVLASRDPEFIGLMMPSAVERGNNVPDLFAMPDWVRQAA